MLIQDWSTFLADIQQLLCNKNKFDNYTATTRDKIIQGN